ncbi:MAG: Serine/threonine-protein kinase PrkC [Firmicutes bacterium ADurb.Bin193]|nr:MAG: Serine/threonine-protein kinase PrkC [Firmicutes bacterium ADurb.Bin193]
MIGKILSGRYEIIEEIGNGGMAQVFKARCRLLNRFVAVKILRPEFASDGEFLARFKTEAQAAAALSHNNIVSIYDVGREDGLEYIVMEYVEGMTLKEYIKENKMLSWQQTVDFAIQICHALSSAHKNGIVHRDIKPQNIILTPEGVLKVTDFGIARAATASSVTITGNTMGSVHYLSPEQARGGYTDAKSDIYSLGIVMYEMVTGRLPFEGETPVTVAIKQIQEKPVSPKEYNIAVPLAVETIILKAMNKDQSMRYQSAGEMLSDLEKARTNPNIAFKPREFDTTDITKKIPLVKADDKVTPSADTKKINTGAYVASEKEGAMKKSDKKAIIWAIITSIIIVGALIIGSLAVVFPDIFGGRTNEITIPDLTNKSYEDVKEQYAGQGIIVTVARTDNDSEKEAGTILSQDPKAGKIVKIPSGQDGISVEVVISGGKKEYILANYEKKGFIETKLELESFGIVVSEQREESDNIAEGMIIRTVPGANTRVKAGDTVTLFVSSGAGDTVIMPNLVGLNVQQAKMMIAENKLLEGTVTEADSDKAKGIVIKQSHEANTNVKTYERIDLTISRGPGLQTKFVGISVPQNKPTTRVKVVQNGAVIHDAVHRASEVAFDIPVTGIGTVGLELYYDGILDRTLMVDL